jgi:hypothetical protein
MAAALAVPVATEKAERFFGGLLKAAGKPALEYRQVRRGRAVTETRTAAIGYVVETRRIPTRAQLRKREVVRSVTVPRWAAAVGALAGAVYLVEHNGRAATVYADRRSGWATWWNAHKLAPWWSDFTPNLPALAAAAEKAAAVAASTAVAAGQTVASDLSKMGGGGQITTYDASQSGTAAMLVKYARANAGK